MLKGTWKKSICYLLVFVLVLGSTLIPYGIGEAYTGINVNTSSLSYYSITWYPSSRTVNTTISANDGTFINKITVSVSDSSKGEISNLSLNGTNMGFNLKLKAEGSFYITVEAWDSYSNYLGSDWIDVFSTRDSYSGNTPTYTPTPTPTWSPTPTPAPITETYDIYFDSLNGSSAPSGITTDSSGYATIPSSKPYVSYKIDFIYEDATGKEQTISRTMTGTLKSWNTQPDGTGSSYQPGTRYRFTESTILYAQYACPTISSSTFPTVSKTGAALDGWYTLPIGGTQVKAGDTISSDTTLYAHWTTASCVLTFHANGGTTMVGGQKMIIGEETAIQGGEPYRLGYTFLGWSADSSAKTASYRNGDKLKLDKNMTLYAVWSPYPYTITFSGNGATGGTMKDVSANFDQTVVLPKNEYVKLCNLTLVSNYKGGGTDYKSGYAKFEGWSSSLNSSVQFLNGASVKNLSAEKNGKSTLYAKWAAVEFSLPKLKRVGYEFCGWSNRKDAKNALFEPGEKYRADSDTTLYAVWKVQGNENSGLQKGSVVTYQGFRYEITDLKKRTVSLVSPVKKSTCKVAKIPEQIICKNAFYKVTGIDEYAFYNCSRLAKVVIKPSITKIGECSFAQCPKLKSVVLPKTVTTIDSKAFSGCKSLKKISLPKVKNIKTDSFDGCTALKIGDSANSYLKTYACQTGLYRISAPKLKSKTENGDTTIRWEEPDYCKGYYIYGRTGNGEFTLMQTKICDGKETTMHVANREGVAYEFKVKAYYETKDGRKIFSGDSNTVTVK